MIDAAGAPDARQVQLVINFVFRQYQNTGQSLVTGAVKSWISCRSWAAGHIAAGFAIRRSNQSLLE